MEDSERLDDTMKQPDFSGYAQHYTQQNGATHSCQVHWSIFQNTTTAEKIQNVNDTRGKK